MEQWYNWIYERKKDPTPFSYFLSYEEKTSYFGQTCIENCPTCMWALVLGYNFIPPHKISFLVSMAMQQTNIVNNFGSFLHKNLELGRSSIKTWTLDILSSIHTTCKSCKNIFRGRIMVFSLCMTKDNCITNTLVDLTQFA